MSRTEFWQINGASKNRRQKSPFQPPPTTRMPLIGPWSNIRLARSAAVAVALFATCALAYIFYPAPRKELERLSALATQPTGARSFTGPDQSTGPVSTQDSPRYFMQGNLILVWDTIRQDVLRLMKSTSIESNIAPKDYLGPEACQDCHKENYDNWSQHPHRWMNALAKDETVKGDFSGEATIHYRGGVGKFYRSSGKYRMSFQRDDLTRVYEISQTIGSRFYQYYVGKGMQGPEPKDHAYYRADQVLPFGYWLDRQAWVPVVHVHDELPEHQRWELVEHLRPSAIAKQDSKEESVGRSRGVFDHEGDLPLTYASACNYCHTTFSLADMFLRMPDSIGESLTERSMFSISNYIAETRPNIWDGSQPPESIPWVEVRKIAATFIGFEAPHEAVTLGISCEACHLGGRLHAENKNSKPSFAPHSPHLFSYSDPSQLDTGRTHANVNSTCARCHVGTRPTYAGGMSTWNSTEYTDDLRGSCYSQLKCIDCHDPHKPIGKKWSKLPEQDDASCLKCHDQYSQLQARQLHTHHTAGSSGDRCMNCHAPHINEGMQDVVRTHTIFSPTQPAMIEANHPNACNLCHLDKPIDWTLGYLKSWYGKSFSDAGIANNYPDRQGPVGLGWLAHEHPATRLVAAAAMARQDAQWAVPALIELLDDDYLMNRQFTQMALESLLNVRLNEKLNYWHYHTKKERQQPLSDIGRSLR